MVIDAGGGTIDMSTYLVHSTSPTLHVAESGRDCMSLPCFFHDVLSKCLPKLCMKAVLLSLIGQGDSSQVSLLLGGIGVSVTFTEHLRKSKKFNTSEYIDCIVSEFDAKSKRIFTGKNKALIKFGRNSDKDESVQIISGKLVLDTCVFVFYHVLHSI